MYNSKTIFYDFKISSGNIIILNYINKNYKQYFIVIYTY